MCLHDGGDGGGGVGHAQPEREAARRHGGCRQNLSAAKYDGDYFLVISKLEINNTASYDCAPSARDTGWNQDGQEIGNLLCVRCLQSAPADMLMCPY